MKEMIKDAIAKARANFDEYNAARFIEISARYSIQNRLTLAEQLDVASYLVGRTQ